MRAADIPFMLIGGQAVIVHGEPRLTRDVDFVLAVDPLECKRVIKVMDRAGVIPAIEDPEAFVVHTLLLPCDDRKTNIRVDLAFTDSRYEQDAIKRAVIIDVEGEPVPFATPEDLIVHKLIAMRPQDVIDVRGVILKNPSLNVDQVRHWLREFEPVVEKRLLDAFEKLLKECRKK